jgi:hypothetical protein
MSQRAAVCLNAWRWNVIVLEEEEDIKGFKLAVKDEDTKIIVTGYIALKMNEEKFHQELWSGCWHPCEQSATPHRVLILHIVFVTSLII